MNKSFFKHIINKDNLKTVGLLTVLTLIGSLLINYITDESTTTNRKVIFIIILIVITISVYILNEYLKWKEKDAMWRKNRMNKFYADSIVKLDEQKLFLDRYFHGGNYFKLMLANFRLKTEHNKFKKIWNAGTEFWALKALEMWDYFIYVFRAIMRELLEGDEYITVSVLEFWNKDKPSSDIESEQSDLADIDKRNLFETNYDKCSIANMLSKRVILINSDLIEQGKINSSNTNAASYREHFKSIVFKYADDKYQHDNFKNIFYLTNSNEYNLLLEQDVPYAIIKRANYSNLMCISTYIPTIHTPYSGNDKNQIWRTGKIAKVGFYIPKDENDELYQKLYRKFEQLFYKEKRESNNLKGVAYDPKELKEMIVAGLK